MDHFWQLYNDLSSEKVTFSQKKAKKSHYDVIIGQNTYNKNFQPIYEQSPLTKDHFAKKSKFIAFFV